MTNTNIDKPLTNGGENTARLDMNQFIKLADAEKFEFDALNEVLESLREKWKNEREPGETFDSWFNRTSKEDIIKLSMANGGKVIDLARYRKTKEPAQVKEINLSDYFDLNKRLIDLSSSERDTLKWLLNKSLNPKK